MEYIREQIIYQNEVRTNWIDHDNPEFLRLFLFEEFEELEEAIEQDKPAVEVASEVGDCFYLLTRLAHETGKSEEQILQDDEEIRGVIEKAQEVCNLTGLDPRDCVEMKLLRNSVKYPDWVNSNGYGWELSTKLSKDLYSGLGGDLQFYQWYEQNGERIKNGE